MLQETSSAMPRARGWLLVALVALAGVLPYRVVAASHAESVQAGTSANAITPSAPPAPPSPPAALPPPPKPPRPPVSGFNARNVDIDIDSGARQGLALFDGDTVIISGTAADEAEAKRLHAAPDEPLLWLRRDDQGYVIRDRATVERARQILAPVEDYWRHAGRFEDRQWRIKGPMEGLQAWQDSVRAQRRELLADPDAPAFKQRLASLDRQQRDITARLGELRRQLAALQPQIDAMGKQQQAVTENAYRRMSELVADAMTRGQAQRVSPH